MGSPADTIREGIGVDCTYEQIVAALAALTELEQQLAALAEAQQFPVETVFAWKNRAVAAEADRDRLQALMIEMRSKPCYEAFDERDRLRVQLEQLVTAVEEHKPACARIEADRDQLADTLREAEAVLIEISSKPYRAEEATAAYFARAALDRHTKDTP
jgi:hypothetical protein